MSSCSGFSVEGPSQAKIECDDKGDGSCDVRYWPTEPGEYAVHVLCNNEDIQHSPFMAEIVNAPGKDFYPDKVRTHPGTRAGTKNCVLDCFFKAQWPFQVKAYGPGLQSSGLAVGKPTEFTVDTKQGGTAPLKIVAQVVSFVVVQNVHLLQRSICFVLYSYIPLKDFILL